MICIYAHPFLFAKKRKEKKSIALRSPPLFLFSPSPNPPPPTHAPRRPTTHHRLPPPYLRSKTAPRTPDPDIKSPPTHEFEVPAKPSHKHLARLSKLRFGGFNASVSHRQPASQSTDLQTTTTGRNTTTTISPRKSTIQAHIYPIHPIHPPPTSQAHSNHLQYIHFSPVSVWARERFSLREWGGRS